MDEENRFQTGYVMREIERHYGVKDGWRQDVTGTHLITNCYFPRGKKCNLTFQLVNGGQEFEIRTKKPDGKGEFLTYRHPLCRDMRDALTGDTMEHLFPKGKATLRKGMHARIRFWNDLPDGHIGSADPERMEAYFTIKAKNGGKDERYEFEIPLPMAVARSFVGYAPHRVSKIRHDVMHKNHKWEIDEFLEPHRGEFVAEIELNSQGDAFEIPPWVGPACDTSNIKLARKTRLLPDLGEGVTGAPEIPRSAYSRAITAFVEKGEPLPADLPPLTHGQRRDLSDHVRKLLESRAQSANTPGRG